MNNKINLKPTGNVTFLFTDIEGSTKLAQEYQDTLQSALEIHNSILNNAVESNCGFVFEIVGDAFCCSFQNAADAVNAAVEAQQNLTNEKWKDAVIKVRMGIHSGQAVWNGKGYMGYMTLAKSTRVMSAAYGGQIIISDITFEQLKEWILDVSQSSRSGVGKNEITFRDMGERRLKDVNQPIRLYQVLDKKIPEDFPPLKTLDARPNNLPVQLSSFIGREKEMKDIKRLIRKTHLLSIIGAGGSGKTRLAMQVGAEVIDEYANGVFLFEFASVSDPSLTLQTVMTSIGIKEESGRHPIVSLIRQIKDKELLFVFDNCEHIINEIAQLTENLLTNCQKLKIIATSREALNCAGEQTYKIPMMSVPGNFNDLNPESILNFESSLLFLERAFSVNPNFTLTKDSIPSLAEICKRLDGIPLALELAAASTKFLSVKNINERLDNRFSLLTAGKRTALQKHQTLKALIDWSYDLLSEKERLLWERLSIFKGGWDLKAAEEICSDDTISRHEIMELHGKLTEKSIINFSDKKGRYSILETIKKYGEDKLRGVGEEDIYLNRHLDYYIDYSENAESKFYNSEIIKWLDKLEADHLNFQSAIEWAVKDGNTEKGARLTVSLSKFWDIRGYFSAGIKLVYNILENQNEISKPVLGNLFLCAAQMARFRGEFENSVQYFNKCLTISRELGDKLLTASSLNGLGNIEFDFRNYNKAKNYYEEALALRRETGDKKSIAKSLNNLGNLAFRFDDYEEGKKYYEESLDLARNYGDKRGVANSLHNLANLTFDKGDFETGRKFSDESLELRKELGDKIGIAESFFNLGRAFFLKEKYEESKGFYEESLKYFREIGDVDDIVKTLNRLGDLESILGNYDQALKIFEESIILAEELNNKELLSEILYEKGYISFNLKNFEDSRKLFSEYLKLIPEMKDINNSGLVLLMLAGLPVKDGNEATSVKLLGASETVLKSMEMELKGKEKTLKKQLISKLKEQFGEQKFNKYYKEGKRMTIEEAAELILLN